MSKSEGLELLEQHPFARGLLAPQVEVIARCARVVRFPERAIVFREGDLADTLYLIVRGRVVLEQHVPGKEDVQLEELRAGDILGLSWFFPDGRWILDARATAPTDAIALEARCLRASMDSDAELGLALAKHIIHQLYQRLERVRLQRLDVYRSGR